MLILMTDTSNPHMFRVELPKTKHEGNLGLSQGNPYAIFHGNNRNLSNPVHTYNVYMYTCMAMGPDGPPFSEAPYTLNLKP